MHELSLCRSILDIVNEHVGAYHKSCVKKIALEVGLLSCIDSYTLRYSFEVAAKGTVAENATLEIIEIAGQGICDICGETSPVKQYFDACRACGHFPLTIVAGDELRVKYMEIE